VLKVPEVPGGCRACHPSYFRHQHPCSRRASTFGTSTCGTFRTSTCGTFGTSTFSTTSTASTTRHFLSYTTLPSTTVMSTFILRMSRGSIVMRFRSHTVRSASLPALIEPRLVWSKAANALLIV